MPAGKPWLSQTPHPLLTVPRGVYWHIYHVDHGPLSANPFSTARMALVGTHAMFYVATDLSGVLWEVPLREVMPDARRRVPLEASTLIGLRAVQLRLEREDVPMIDLGQPGLRTLNIAPDSDEAFAIAQLLHTPMHKRTHPEVRQLREELQAHGVRDMPVLCWPSRQHSTSLVYLAYTPPMQADWWTPLDDIIELDSDLGHQVLQGELAKCRFTWAPGDTDATSPV